LTKTIEAPPAGQAAALAAPFNKLRQLLLRPALVAMLGQANPRVNLRDVFREKKIILIPLNEGLIGEGTASLLGSLVIAELWQAAQERAGDVLADSEGSARLLKKQLTTQLESLDVKEANLIDLAADGTIPRDKVRERLRDIAAQREKLSERMEAVTEDLGDGVALIDECLKLLEHPQELYGRCTDEQRRTLNQALFVKLLIQEDTITGHHLNEPFAELHTLQRVQNLIAAGIKDPDKIRQHAQKIHAENTGENKRATPAGGSLNFQKAEALPGTLNERPK
jgi:hypothetical protein